MQRLLTEKNLFSQGITLIGAIDEAGRGPLAGPVVAACVTINPEINYSGLTEIADSKVLSEKKRERLYDVICETFKEVVIGICDNDIIDRINILQASFLAMKKALSALKQKPAYIVVDGNIIIPNISLKQSAIVKGDSTVLSIAAASIIAKVTRDRIMYDYHKIYPEYGFDQHKGYGTKLHLEKINSLGPCAIHRRSFKPVKKLACR